MSPLVMAKIKGINLLDYVEGVVKANTGPMNADQQKDRQGYSIPSGTSLEDLSQVTK